MIGPTGARGAAALNTTAWGYCFAAHLFNGFPEPDVRWAEQSLTLKPRILYTNLIINLYIRLYLLFDTV